MEDVVIVGASFAGLAVASRLKGYRVLLIDRQPIGSGQTSACGTPYQVLRHWRAEAALLQKHHTLVLHTPQGEYPFSSPYPWCTFDYRVFCEVLWRSTQARFVQAAVTGFDGERVITSQGTFRARVFVDASGWRAVLASALDPTYGRFRRANFGIETIAPFRDEGLPADALHFYYHPDILDGGVAWAFPRGRTLSLGVGKYGQPMALKGHLQRFVRKFQAQPESIHGTYFPYRLRRVVLGNLFLVGDAAGMCLGLTGEGIRPALYFGEACGGFVRRVLDRECSLDQALSSYRDFVNAYRKYYRLFAGLQDALTRLPHAWISWLAAVLMRDPFRTWVLGKYLGMTASWES